MNEGRQPQEPLAAWADHTLKQLPPRPAPKTLAPRVLAALARQRALPWYRQTWFQWPRHLQVFAGLVAAAVFGAGIWFLIPHADTVSFELARQAAQQFEPVREVGVTAGILKTLGSALLLLVKSLNGWALAGLLAVAAFIWSTTLGLGTACWRLASGSR
ncbi:MAG TPA: hypothetical protein PLX89_12840 [Verrucomicrobiota bacterium]|nr:hypothetical protein [Verrucomicrobiales bacterium]HRI13879.1 hypothetical protein [Verrucomicrobiota bacterium]